MGVRGHAGGERPRQASLQVDLAGEVGVEQADVAEGGHAPVGPRIAEDQGEFGSPRAGTPLRAVGQADRERYAGALANLPESTVDEGSHGQRRFYSPIEVVTQVC